MSIAPVFGVSHSRDRDASASGCQVGSTNTFEKGPGYATRCDVVCCVVLWSARLERGPPSARDTPSHPVACRYRRANVCRCSECLTSVGNQQVQTYGDSNPAGMCSGVLRTRRRRRDTASDIDLYVNNGTAATKLLAGLYSNAGGKPGSLLSSGSIASPKAAVWNEVPVGQTKVTQGTTYWIALLGTGGQVTYPRRSRRGGRWRQLRRSQFKVDLFAE